MAMTQSVVGSNQTLLQITTKKMQPELLEMKLISESMALSHGTAHVSCLVCVALARQ